MSFLIIHSFKLPDQKHSKTPKDVGIDFEEISIPTKNGKNLYGWWLKAPQKAATIILVHGWGRHSERLLPYIKKLNGRGFNLLAFDSRNHGNSDKDDFSSMLKFAEDISACINVVESKETYERGKISLIGLSIGGAASILAAAQDSRINKVISIGAPANPSDVMELYIRKKHVPKAIIWLAFEYMQYRIGRRFSDMSVDNNIHKTDAKVMLVHGKDDRVVPFSQSTIIMKAANDNQAELWAIEGKGHSNCHYEAGFWNKLIDFLNK